MGCKQLGYPGLAATPALPRSPLHPSPAFRCAPLRPAVPLPLAGRKRVVIDSVGFFLPRKGEGDRNVERPKGAERFGGGGLAVARTVRASRSGPRIKPGDRV